MIILQVITLSELGGAQTVVANLSNSLSQKHKVIVIANNGNGGLWDMLDSSIVQIKCKSLKREISPLNDIKTVLFFKKIEREYKPDIIHLHSSKAGLLGRLAFSSKKIVYTVHGFDSIRLAYRKFLPLEKMMQYCCKAVVGVSQYDVRNLKSEGIDRNVHCVYNGIKLNSAESSNALPDLSKYSKKILCIARLSPQKNHELFLYLAESIPNYAFIWIGNQYDMNNVPHNSFFLGNIPNASTYYRDVDLCLLPSNYEGLPMTIIEAMSFGKPVVASNVGGISEIVKNGINGYVSENTVQDFSKHIEMVFSDESHYNKLSRNSKLMFEADLTVEKMVSGYMNIYKL